MSKDFTLQESKRYYVIVRPALDRERAVALIMSRSSIDRIADGLIQFSATEGGMRIVKDDPAPVLSIMRKKFTIPFRATICDCRKEKKAQEFIGGELMKFCHYHTQRYEAGVGGYEGGIFRLEVCRPFIRSLCPSDSVEKASLEAAATFVQQLVDTPPSDEKSIAIIKDFGLIEKAKQILREFKKEVDNG